MKTMQNIIVTGEVGSGKSTVADALVASFGRAIAALSSLTDRHPADWTQHVLLIDELSADALSREHQRIKTAIAEGGVVVCIARTFAEIPSQVLGLLSEGNGYRHIHTGTTNRPLASLEQISISDPAAMWMEFAAASKDPRRIDDAAERILGLMSLGVEDAAKTDEERRLLRTQLGVLAAALGRSKPIVPGPERATQ